MAHWLVTYEDGRTQKCWANPGLGPSGNGVIVSSVHISDETELTRLRSDLSTALARNAEIEGETKPRSPADFYVILKEFQDDNGDIQRINVSRLARKLAAIRSIATKQEKADG